MLIMSLEKIFIIKTLFLIYNIKENMLLAILLKEHQREISFQSEISLNFIQ